MPHPHAWKGTYYDGQSLVPHHVTITVEPSGLILHLNNGTTLSWEYQDMRQIPGRHSREEVRFEGEPGSGTILVIPAGSILFAIHKHGGPQTRHFHYPPSRLAPAYKMVSAVIAILCVVYALLTWGIPWISEPLTAAIPVRWEIQLGQVVHQQMTAQEAVCKSRSLQKAIEEMMTTLTDPLGPIPYTFQVSVLDNPAVNAMAAPGGYLIVYRGLLEATTSPEELAGVLAHEIQHVLLRHSMHLIVRHVSVALLLAALSGDAGGMVSYGLQAAHTLQTLSYSRTAEVQADEEGLALLHRAGINPAGMLSFFTKLDRPPSGDTLSHYLSTHPEIEARRTHLEALLPHTTTYPPFSFHSNWAHIKSECATVAR